MRIKSKNVTEQVVEYLKEKNIEAGNWKVGENTIGKSDDIYFGCQLLQCQSSLQYMIGIGAY